ncbi:MAG: hypothetical protein MJZ30_13585 [Paludibacteraceae bacterium]|nr:hypothetical protein [Paludibacteraceae bacterium]
MIKKFNKVFYLTLLSSLIAGVVGCSDDEEEAPKLELNATELTFKSEGGDELVGVTSNTNWSAVSSEKWCEVSPSSSNGNGAIKVTAQKNEKSESRTAKISVVSGSLTRIVMVSQAGSGSENGSGGNNEEGGNGSGNENGGGNGSNNDGDNTPNPTVTYTVTLTSSPNVGGSVTGGGSYEQGKVATISASANSGYRFVKWSDGVTTNPRTLTVTSNKTITAYFEQNSSNSSAVDGKLRGRFSVSATKQVSFSMGNLQYQASTKTWRFAENQYDVIGTKNENISSTYSGWIDLFGWGTSGYNSRYPYMTSTDYSDYGNGIYDISGTNYDWGVYNAISNGDNKAGMWRTLTKSEWEYLFDTRTNAENLRGLATVNGQTGYILLPDGWSMPSGLTFTANFGDYTTNSYSASEWSKMEAAGAVFLPAAGYRYGASVSDVGSYGGYWSSTYYSYRFAYGFNFSSSVGTRNYNNRYFGNSVRLVQE